MKINKQDIILFKIVSIVFFLLSIVIIIFFSKAIGFPLMALSLYSLFAPFKDRDDIRVFGHIKRASKNEFDWDNKTGAQLMNELDELIPNDNEQRLLEDVCKYIEEPLLESKYEIEKYEKVKHFTFIYLVGLVNGCCDFYKIFDTSFIRMYNYFFITILKNAGYDFYEFSSYFVSHYNEMLDVKYIEDIISCGARDIMSYYERKRNQWEIKKPVLRDLVKEWIILTPDNYTLEVIKKCLNKSNPENKMIYHQPTEDKINSGKITSADKDLNLMYQKFGITDLTLNKKEIDLINLISGLVAIPLSTNKEIINNNIMVKSYSFFYLLGVIDGFCQELNYPNSSFYKICLTYFQFDLRNSEYNYYKFASFFLERYNQIIKYRFIKDIMKLGGEDVLSELDSIAKNEKIRVPQTQLNTLIYEWSKLNLNDILLEQKQFLLYVNGRE